MLQFVVILVPVQSRHGTLDRLATSLHRGPHERLWSGSVNSDHSGALSDLSILPQCLSDHNVGHEDHRHTKGEVDHVERQDGFPFSGDQTGHGKAEVRLAGFQGGQGGEGETGGPEEQSEEQGAGEGGRAVGLLPQHHAEPVQGNHRHCLEGHDDEARAGEVEGEAESVRYATGWAEEQHEGEHGGCHATNEEVTEGQVQDHEIKVGSEFPEGRIEEGQEDNEVAVRAQAEDDCEQKGTGDQGGRVDGFLETLLDTGTVPSLGVRHVEQGGVGHILKVACWVHLQRRLFLLWEGSQGLNSQTSDGWQKGPKAEKPAHENASPETERNEWRQQSDLVIFYKSTRLFQLWPSAQKAFLLPKPHTEKT